MTDCVSVNFKLLTMSNILATVLVICILCSSINRSTNSADMGSLSKLFERAKQTNGIIEGNPLFYPECANALLSTHKHNLDYLSKSAMPNPWFWSRESIDAATKNFPLTRRTKLTINKHQSQFLPQDTLIAYDYAASKKQMPMHILRWYSRLGTKIDSEFKRSSDLHSDNICFHHIEKAGSSSIAGMMHEYDFNTTYTSENVELHCECGFTFVRDPISRFVSGYYTINKLIYWYHDHLKRLNRSGPNMDAVPDSFTFWNITGEPQRMIEFVENIWDYSYEFTKTSPLEHLMTQTGLLAVSKLNIHYIGDVSQLMEHLEIIKNKCAEKTNNQKMLNQDLVEKKIMTSFGTKWMDELRPWYTDMLSLDDYVKGDLDPAYMALADNYDLYHKVVEYYRQDYVCFGFEHDWKKFRNKIYAKLNETIINKQKRNSNSTNATSEL